ncbi:hypothetical protein [Parasphingorhabdus sp.]|jgi:hypothetical protein|uniref:hypothetical protein n=1 Tax=Parasphingorhabdus sp. TaxID=2709688 RepID=UPI0030A53770
MNMLEKIMDMLPENFSIDDIAEKAGMTVDEAKKGGEALFAKLRDGSMDKMTAIKEAAAEAGVDPEKLKGLLPALAEKAGLDGEDGLLGKVTGFFDRDGDGNPINDLTNKAKGFFKK